MIPKWGKSKVRVAYERGIIKGYTDNSFKPFQKVTRLEFLIMIMNAFELNNKPIASIDFSDKKSIPEWAYDSITKAVGLNLISGYTDGTIRINNNITRAEVFNILSKTIKQK
jgi:hypothetical protein